jgi:hypothetical protein
VLNPRFAIKEKEKGALFWDVRFFRTWPLIFGILDSESSPAEILRRPEIKKKQEPKKKVMKTTPKKRHKAQGTGTAFCAGLLAPK